MSRNFDLLAEVAREREFDPQAEHVHALPGRPAANSAAKEEYAAEVEDSAELEMFGLVSAVFLTGKNDAPHCVLFLGVDDESGSSSVCASAGQTLARSTSKTVCLVDGNIHSGRLSDIFGTEKSILFPGKHGSVREQCKQLGSNLWLAGPDHMADGRGSRLSIEELKFRLEQLRDEFDYLLIDGPGARSSTDAELLAQFADGSILVIEADKTRRSKAAKTKDSLEAAGVRVLGSVLNNRSFPIPAGLYKML